ncbi:MAG: rod shape-determining protein MreC [bacterium]
MQQRRLSTRSYIILVITLVGLGLVLNIFGINKHLVNFITIILNPAQEITLKISNSVSGWFSSNETEEDLKFENDRLTTENILLLKELTQARFQLDDAITGMNQAEYLEEFNYQYRTARVVGLSNDPASRVLIINQGDKNGLAQGQAVVSEQGVIIGKIIEVYANTAQVLLLTDRRSKISAIVQNNTFSPGLVEGERGLSLTMTMIPQDEKVETDQLIATSGFEMLIPRGLIIGKLGEVSSTDIDLFKTANVELLQPIDKIQIVSVILPP